ncbi:MAG: hypothetical protein HYV08_16895 [Deltaproteobacteria bacterium]|nr:hypothetical protein [Deltaproteobacteria bacterium]MBI3079571.1 hypothetical protein [Deltaproteobacteria bacterium]
MAEPMPSAERSFAEQIARELRDLVARYGAGEAEIARAYFSRPRTTQQEVTWLTIQAGRELSRVFQLWDAIAGRIGRLGEELDRHELEALLKKLLEETRHFNLFTDILEWLRGEPVRMAELRRYDFFRPEPAAPNNSENVRLAEINQEIDKLDEPWAELVKDQGLLEGGGCGLFYAASQISGGELEERVARAMRVVLEDELRHGPLQVDEVAGRVRTPEELEKVKAYTRLRGDQRLRWRNQQFSYPLSDARIREIQAGKIDPLDLTTAAPARGPRP